MGWNDRLPEDPYIPFFTEQDRIAYEEWHQYVLECERLDADCRGLTSANLKLPLEDNVPPPAATPDRPPAVPIKQEEQPTN